jgi:hypothetical protein
MIGSMRALSQEELDARRTRHLRREQRRAARELARVTSVKVV